MNGTHGSHGFRNSWKTWNIHEILKNCSRSWKIHEILKQWEEILENPWNLTNFSIFSVIRCRFDDDFAHFTNKRECKIDLLSIKHLWKLIKHPGKILEKSWKIHEILFPRPCGNHVLNFYQIYFTNFNLFICNTIFVSGMHILGNSFFSKAWWQYSDCVTCDTEPSSGLNIVLNHVLWEISFIFSCNPSLRPTAMTYWSRNTSYTQPLLLWNHLNCKWEKNHTSVTNVTMPLF